VVAAEDNLFLSEHHRLESIKAFLTHFFWNFLGGLEEKLYLCTCKK
jgi:hypothetical protein